MTGYDPKLVADALVNLFGAFGVLIISYNLRQFGRSKPALFRMRWALRLLAAIFAVRCLAWVTGNSFLFWLADAATSTTPLAALVIAEGLMRRHAPLWLKTGILTACPASIVLASMPVIAQWFSTSALMLVIVLGIFAVVGFLVLRDQNTLTDAENIAARKLTVFLGIMAPLIAIDIRSAWPDMPLHIGAVGVLAVLFVSFGPGSKRTRGWERILGLVVFSTIAGLFALGYVASGQGGGIDHLIRAGSVGISGLLCAALFAELLGAQGERRKRADPLLDAANADQFLSALKQHAVIGDAGVIEGRQIEPLRHHAFDTLLEDRPVLRGEDAPWGRPNQDMGVERAMSLLKTYDATHALRLSADPMRLAVFKLPQSSTDARLESELKAAQRIGEFLIARDMTT